MLTAVVDGEVAFATLPGAATPGVLCAALLGWAVSHGATRAYVQVLVDNAAATALYESMGFAVHHRSCYVGARTL